MKNRITSTEPKTYIWYANELKKVDIQKSDLNKRIKLAIDTYIKGIYKNTRLGVSLAQGKGDKKAYKEDYKNLTKLYLHAVDLISQLIVLDNYRYELLEGRRNLYEQSRKQSD